MAQHFLMSAAARTLSLVDLCDLSEDAAHKMLCEMRWEDTDGAPVCPHCSCPAVYTYRCRRVFKCKACHRQFSATSGTLLAHRKLAFRTLLMAFSLFVNAAKGLSSLQLSRNLGLHAKTAFVLLHKLRCALTSNSTATILSGVVEIDGGWFGGYIRPENHRVARIDRRRREHQNGKRLCVVAMRQRGGKTVTTVVKHEAEAVPIIRRRVARGSIVHADEARAWDDLHATFEMKRIDHGRAYSANAPAQTRRRAISPGCGGRRSANITISRGRILISTPAKWLGAKTCAGKPPVRSLTHVAALFSAIHRHVVGLDIGSVICKRRSYVKPRDRRSARGRHDQRRPEQAARVC